VNKLPEVESAKALMSEAMSWSVMRWLREKRRVRKTADIANAVLDKLSETTKARWDKGLKTAYEEIVGADELSSTGKHGKQISSTADRQLMALAKRVKDADDEARRARLDAEKTFDDAERQLSTSLAREGCRKAIHGWELHEKAIRKAEAACQ